MKTLLKTHAGQIAKAMALIMKVIERRTTIPILSAVLIEGGKAIGTDLDMDISAGFGVIEGGDPFCVEARHLAELSRLFDDQDEVTFLQTEDGGVVLRCGQSAHRLVSHPATDFQRLALKGPQGAWRSAGNWGLRDALKGVAHAISAEETRYYLNGVCFSEWKDGLPCLVATDGHRLSLREVDGASGFDGQIVPRKAVQIITSLGEVDRLRFYDNGALFQCGGATVSTKLIDGTFPDFTRVIPAPEERVINLPTEATGVALKRVALASQEGSRSIGFVRHGIDGVALSVRGMDGSEAFEVVKGASTTITERDVLVGLNAKYVGEMLAKAGADEVRLECRDSASSLASRAKGRVDVLMPLRHDTPAASVSQVLEDAA